MTPAETSWFHPAFVLLLLGTGLSVRVWLKLSFRRGMQVFSVGLFISLFWLASFDGRPRWPVELYLFSDPLLALVHTLAGRVLVPLLLVSLAFVVLAAVMGRVFCSHVCPLGVLLDLSDRWLGKPQRAKHNRENFKRTRKAKFVFLLVILGAAAGGFNLLGFGDPIVLFTRFAATLFYPFVMLLQEIGIEVLRPLGELLGWVELAYLEMILPAFEGAFIMGLLLLVLLLLSRMQPRFWCRHLCPLGALLGWIGKWAPYRRRVSEACNACNICVRQCPTGAIHQKGEAYDRNECIVCLKCTSNCPEKAVSFGFAAKDAIIDQPGTQLARRAFMGSVAGGLTVGLTMRADILHPSHAFLPLPLRHHGLIRPPGALPEPEFLSRCVRCGECMRACLTNTLQPDWYRAGLEGLWAPRMNLRYASCEQICNVCGWVCPTQAIRPLDLKEKQHAKVGTAVILRDMCLPWSQDRRCLICDEQCPYNAIVFQHDDKHKVPLPVVDDKKCNGCGQCEDKCPVTGDSAIIVSPQGELRLKEGSYVAECESLGLIFEAKDRVRDQFKLEGEPIEKPAEKPELPPGIIPED